MTDVAIIGAGHNALAAAFYLAKAGLKPIVFERAPRVGGGAITSELCPGFNAPTLSHELLLHDDIARDMNVADHGVERLPQAAQTCALTRSGPPLVLWHDQAKCAEALKSHSQRDADAYARFRETLDAAASVLSVVLTSQPPDIDRPGASDVWQLLKAGRAFRALGRRNEYELLRWIPMPVADLVNDWFENNLLKAAIAAPGVSGTMLGPRSAGSSLVLLLREAHRRLSSFGSAQVRGGPGRLTQAMAAAATAAGAEIRTGARVERIVVRDERVHALVVDGQEIRATTIVSGADPKTTFLDLVDPAELAPDFRQKVRHYRAKGTVAKVNVALSALPSFRGVTDPSAISGRIHIGPDLDYIERAFDHVKYGEASSAPWLEVSIPSILDPDLAPAGAHVLSVYAHYVPYDFRGGEWSAAKSAFLARVLDTLDGYAPGLQSTVIDANVIAPPELHADYGLFGGHIFHGELALDQLYTMRPLLGFGRYDTPLHGLFLCGAGTHPGGFMTGASGRLAARRVLQSRS